MQRLQRERRVAHPGVAVVPVALPARRLRQRRRQRGDRRAGRHVGQALDRECRALDRVPVAMVGNPSTAEPRRARTVSYWRSSTPHRRRRPASRAPRPRRGHRMPARPPEACGGPGRETPRCRVRDPRRGGSSGPRRLRRRGDAHRPRATTPRMLGRSRTGARRGALPRRSLRGTRPCARGVLGVVVRGRPRVRGDRVLVIGRPHRQGVADDYPPGRRLPRRHEHIRAGLVVPGRRMVDVVRREAERARPRGRAGCRRRSARRSVARRASRSRRRARRAHPCGSWRGTRSPRSG